MALLFHTTVFYEAASEGREGMGGRGKGVQCWPRLLPPLTAPYRPQRPFGLRSAPGPRPVGTPPTSQRLVRNHPIIRHFLQPRQPMRALHEGQRRWGRV